MADSQTGLSVDTALDILASARQREILRYLLDQTDPPRERGELVDKMADTAAADPESLEIAVAHHHLPRLADAGVIEYDHRSGSVRLDGTADDLRPLLELCQEWETAEN